MIAFSSSEATIRASCGSYMSSLILSPESLRQPDSSMHGMAGKFIEYELEILNVEPQQIIFLSGRSGIM